MPRQDITKLIQDWKDTLKEKDPTRKNLKPFLQQVSRQLATRLKSGAHKFTNGEESPDGDNKPVATERRAVKLNGGFFAKIASLEWKKQSSKRHFDQVKNFAKAEEEVEEYGGDEKEVKKVSRKKEKVVSVKRADLYSELVHVICNEFVSEQQKKKTPVQGEVYVYGQEVFGITAEEHREIFSETKKRKPPTCCVEVTVVEARDIEAKDANGYSDPYCMLGIVTDTSFDRKLKRKPSKTQTVSELLEEHLIQVTTVKKKTLNPKWNETHTLKVGDVFGETLHIDMWDEDEDTSFLDKDNRITQIRGVAGVGRFLKQVVQSSRKCSGSTSMDDFLGFIEIPIKDIPSQGVDKWFPLQARSAKSKTDGECHLILKLVGKNNNEEDEKLGGLFESETLAAFLEAFLIFDGDHTEDFDDVDTSGHLSCFAEWVIHQYVIQNNISSLRKAVVQWRVYSKYHQMHPLKYSFLNELLSNIISLWTDEKLSSTEEEKLSKSLRYFVRHCMDLLKDHRELYPATDSSKVSRLSNMLRCLKTIGELTLLFEKEQCLDIVDEITGVVKMSAEKWYSVQYAWHEPQEPTQTSAILALVTFAELIVVELIKALRFYNNVFKQMDIDYFSITYPALEKLLASDMHSSITQMDPETLHVEVGDVDLGVRVFSLYLASKEIMDYRQYLPISDKQEFVFDSSHVWFKQFVEHWTNVAHQKALASITKAVEIDQAIVVDSSVKYSTSAIDVTSCFHQISEVWKRLRWPDATESYCFVTKLTKDICEASCFYGDALLKKLKDNDFYDAHPVYFGVSERLCITLNNLAYTQQWLNDLDSYLDWSGVVSAMKSSVNEDEAKKCEESLIEFSNHTRDVLFSKIDEMIFHIGEKMAFDIKRFVLDIVNQKQDTDIYQTMDPLLSYLEGSLRTFFTTLLRVVFDRTLLHLWTLVVDHLVITLGKVKGKPPLFYRRLDKILETLIDFFCVDGVGIPLERIMSDKVKLLVSDLKVHQLSSEELIEEYYLEKMMQKADESLPLGSLSLRMFYDLKNQKLHVELLNGRNLPPLDSDGLCDPYVKVSLCPRHLFPGCPTERTEVKAKTLFPIFDAKFIFSVPVEACKKLGAHLQLSVYDHDVLIDDVAGQVFVPLHGVPGLDEEIPATFHGIEQLILPLIHPKTDGKSFAILQARNDDVAVKFIKEKLDLANKLSGNLDKILTRTQRR